MSDENSLLIELRTEFRYIKEELKEIKETQKALTARLNANDKEWTRARTGMWVLVVVGAFALAFVAGRGPLIEGLKDMLGVPR